MQAEFKASTALIAGLVPGARVVKAFNHMPVPNIEDTPPINSAKRVAFFSADDADAKTRVHALLERCNYSVVDPGNLRDGGLMQQAGGPLAGRDFFEKGEYHK